MDSALEKATSGTIKIVVKDGVYEGGVSIVKAAPTDGEGDAETETPPMRTR